MASQESVAPIAVSLRGVDKVYGEFYALRGLHLDFEAGRIHALVGQNGAGKSTCLGIIAGRTTASTGVLHVDDVEYPGGFSAREAAAAGIATVYQELSVFPALSVLENVFVGQLTGQLGLVNWRLLRRRFDELTTLLGASVDPDAIVGSLSVAQQQIVEILRGLALDSRVLLLDEPTAVLAPAERQALFRVMRELRDRGVTIIFVSHYLDEVLAIADTVSVFRDGRLVEKALVGEHSEETIVAAMLGAEAPALAAAAEGQLRSPAVEAGEILLSVEGLAAGRVEGVNMTVRAGEIVGIGGLVGSGRSTVLRALAGAQVATSGTVTFEGRRMRPPRSPRAARRMGIGYIPEDRKRSGLIIERSSKDNIALGDFAKVSRMGVVRRSTMDRVVSQLAAKFGLADRALDLAVGRLSGGNQQKVLFARSGLHRPKLLLADESTRGVDIGSKGGIMRTLRVLADEGMGVVFVSSDLQEVAAVSDRIYVFKSGRVVGEFTDTDGVTHDDILARAFGMEVRDDR